MSLFTDNSDTDATDHRSQNELSAVLYGVLIALLCVALFIISSTGMLVAP